MSPPAGSGAMIRGIPPINPATGLSTDYLNHFSEAMMILEMLPDAPECLSEFLAWEPKSYAEHFASSAFTDAPHVISAYEAAEPELRRSLDTLSDIMNAMLTAAREAMAVHGPGPATDVLAARTAKGLKPLISRTAAMINGAAPALYVDRTAVDSIDAVFAR
jgi:Xaa-Pro aminopeptidase